MAFIKYSVSELGVPEELPVWVKQAEAAKKAAKESENTTEATNENTKDEEKEADKDI